MVVDTHARQSSNKFGFALDLFVSLTDVLDTHARQSSNKFGFALDLFVSLRATSTPANISSLIETNQSQKYE